MFKTVHGSIGELSQPEEMYGWLGDDALAQIPSGKRQKAWLAGRVLLAQSIQVRPLPAILLASNGKPAFSHAELPAFNISHSGDCVFVAIAMCGQIGCDVELIRERPTSLEIAHHYFSSREYAWLAAQPDEGVCTEFWRLWTVREAILKQKGASVWQMQSIQLDPETLATPDVAVSHWYQNGYSFAVAIEE
ncbi:MAG: 4'-phosphopantetheinyl transferase superfamily protein [Ewingella sp.]